MYDGSLVAMIALVPFHAYEFHHLCIAYTHQFLAYLGSDALAGNLFNIRNLAAVCTLVGKSITQGGTNGVVGRVLHMGCQVQQLVFAAYLGVYGLNGKAPMRQRAGLVEHDGIYLRQDIQIVGSLHQDTLS